MLIRDSPPHYLISGAGQVGPSAALRKGQLLHHATPYYPFPRRNIHTRGNIWSFTVG